MERISWDEYFLRIAYAVSARSNCIRRQIGAVIVNEKIIESTGYNGTPMGVPNCFDGGCERCNSDGPSGAKLDECICIHAEENAIMHAARTGVSLKGNTAYVTWPPCSRCTRSLIQAGIEEVVFPADLSIPERWNEDFDIAMSMMKEAGVRVRQI